MPSVETLPIVTGVSAGHEWATASAADMATTYGHLADLGVQAVRFVIDWSVVEAVQGTLDWSVYDGLVDGAIAAGFQVLAGIGYTPAWARAADGDPNSAQTRPASNTQFAAFCSAVVSRYGNRIHDWEIWNEPNLAQFWKPAANPTQYAALAVAASAAIRAVQPSANVIIGALAMSGDEQPNMGVHNFLTGCFANASFKACFNALSLHPYCYPHGFRGADDWAHKQVRRARQVMISQGLANRPVWLTEFGATTSTTTWGATEQQQGKVIAELFDMAARCDWIAAAFFYKDRDHVWPGNKDESHFGVLHENFTRKAGWSTIRTAVTNAKT